MSNNSISDFMKVSERYFTLTERNTRFIDTNKKNPANMLKLFSSNDKNSVKENVALT